MNRFPQAMRAAACILVVSLGACGKRGINAPPLRPMTLTPAQRGALAPLNGAGSVAMQGETRSFALGAPCTLRVVRLQDGRVHRVDDVPLLAHNFEVIEYGDHSAFGLKAYPIKAGGSVDLIDASTRSAADSLLRSLQVLREACLPSESG